jgi:predicted acetyltransferase
VTSLEIRKLVGEERHEADLIWLQAFQRGTRSGLAGMDAYRERLGDRIERFGLWDSGGLQATFELVHSALQFGPESVLPTGYIASIACLPAGRGRGYGGAGIAYLLQHMRDAGQVVSTLQPFDFDYYRRFGWEWICTNRFYKIPSRVLRPDPETKYVRAATKEDCSRICGAYTRFAGGYRGMVARDDTHWNRLLDDTNEHVTYTYLYEREGEVEGYLIYRGGNAEETWLPEFITSTPRSQRGLLGLLRRHEMQVRNYAWKAPEDDGLWSQCFHKEMETKLGTILQGRVVDLVGALSAWKPDPSARGTLLLGIHDTTAPWNHGTWKVTFDEGVVSVSATKAEAQIQMDIQAFTQAFFGVLTVPSLRKRERLQVHAEPGYLALCELLAGPPMWMSGDF